LSALPSNYTCTYYGVSRGISKSLEKDSLGDISTSIPMQIGELFAAERHREPKFEV
jgi:hypothetical protein